ncbi:hypothetical protein D1610_11570 [Sphingomonas gilva]|uniref:Uncharacterized protein n=1 Tax=Sphingomonas gilva TaxID=2305907 RepID=A0A396RU22_9SPHN|nr:glycosyl hydrolase 108 family protein [Sphingomonas gilva]RHW17181.1 hypothetical protein D1610_11570 [Sphingomonas gilva]
MGQESDIIATDIEVWAWSRRFGVAFDRLLGVEGGHVNDPVDRGGETKYGISLRFLASEGRIDLDADGIADFDLDMDGDIDGADIRKLTIGDARYLYHRCFWRRLDIELLPRPIGEMVFDQAVNGGARAAGKMLQQSINALLFAGQPKLVVDGVIGPATRSELAQLLEQPHPGMPGLVGAFRDAAKLRYRAIASADPSQNRFLKGWLRRADELGRNW